MKKITATLSAVALVVLAAGCNDVTPQDPKVTINKNPYPSTYQPLPRQDVLIQHATVLTGTGERLDNADVLMVDHT